MTSASVAMSANNNNSSSGWNQVFQCAICGELYNDSDRLPKVLECGHTFCAQCIDKIPRYLLTESTVCRHDHVLMVFILMLFFISGFVSRQYCIERRCSRSQALVSWLGVIRHITELLDVWFSVNCCSCNARIAQSDSCVCTACRLLLCWKCALSGDAHKGHREHILVWQDFVQNTAEKLHETVVCTIVWILASYLCELNS